MQQPLLYDVTLVVRMDEDELHRLLPGGSPSVVVDIEADRGGSVYGARGNVTSASVVIEEKKEEKKT